MTRDDIIRKFLDLHPDTPIDDKQYAVPLWVIRRMLETAETAEREACAKECEHTALRMGSEWMAQHCAEAIRARGQG